jgi:hypothetical protein
MSEPDQVAAEMLDTDSSMTDAGERSNYYEGCADVIREERKLLQRRPDATGHGDDEQVGLAISGGGIRSATFALGGLQALARYGWLSKVDYLSTVSGGGYIGSSLTWLLHKQWGDTRFDTSSDGFPFGTRRPGSSTDGGASQEKSDMLRFLRQHGRYLMPGGGIGALSMLAVVLRGIMVNLLVYLPMILAIFLVLVTANLFTKIEGLVIDKVGRFLQAFSLLGQVNGFIALCLLLVIIFAALGLVYAVLTRFSVSRHTIWYRLRRRYEQVSGKLLGIALALLLIGTVPLVTVALRTWVAELASALSISGALTGVWAFVKSSGKSNGQRKLPLTPVVALGSLSLIYGLLLVAYQAAWELHRVWFYGNMRLSFAVAAGLVFSTCLLGWLINLNYISVHRFYRDRLMETYLPDVSSTLSRLSQPSFEADRARLAEMCCYSQEGLGPYHLINANVVLSDSKDTKMRGRGGDSFVLSPLFCGSEATGWARTAGLGRERSDSSDVGGITLATAMAVSGAAVNPHTGVGGQGPTRSQLLSFLMGLLNIGLGYWEMNPLEAARSTADRRMLPNLLRPGLLALIGTRIHEKRPFVQITDGGHFENLAVYELIRRQVRVIVLLDGAADPTYSFADFANLLKKIRVDFGVKIDINLEDIVPQQKAIYPEGTLFSKNGHSIGRITYADGSTGTLIYIKTSLVVDLPNDLYGYRRANPSFPDQSTADQLFDERQFEAYRELGYWLVKRCISDKKTTKDKHVAAM